MKSAENQVARATWNGVVLAGYHVAFWNGVQVDLALQPSDRAGTAS